MGKATKKELSWFNMKNYAFLHNLTLIDLIKELEWRDYLFRDLDDDSDIFENEYQIKYNRIFSGDPNIEILNQEELESAELVRYINGQAPSLRNIYGELPRLSSREGVSPVTFTELSMYSSAAIEQGFFKRDEENTYIKSNALLASVTGNIDDCLSNRLLTSIDLDDATDDEIITSMTHLLPLWRAQLSLPEKDHVAQKRIGVKTLQKLISNRVLPILDLLLWAKVSGKEITNPMISLLVFDDDPKDTQAIKESIKPFALEAMEDKYTRLLRLYLNKDKELGSTKISELMRRDL
ncbi:DUF6387 family protein [Yersinia pekkanenii]|uniref:Uncharacterized protein n=1 Tax=Yersinia pekkanenii TaxID=1288385 RepID=A0A0T9RCK1_9GAMM|nr:DUF6387 family protein [Yersinia pekkanenii]CNI55928.1 Uncharacterised protein [Yersinia pekkanenii]CRY68307.1 Uncharacterised protein [Yersinia pekkanenii]